MVYGVKVTIGTINDNKFSRFNSSKSPIFNKRNIRISIIESNMCKKLIYNREIEIVKLGNKNFISRAELIRYLECDTILTIESQRDLLKSA